MIPFADHIAELTSHRDRDLLDLALAGALNDMVRPCMVSIHRCVGEADDRHWLNRARLRSGDAVATADRSWSELDTLPKQEPGEAKFIALTTQRVVTVPGPPHRVYFPMFGSGRGALGVIEFEIEAALDEAAQRTIDGVLRIHRNFDRLLDYSERDTLTGLLNRKTFDESFLKATADLMPSFHDASDGRRARGLASGCWIGVIDIDHFKRVNDRYGHLIGDEVLLLLSRLMARSLRNHDRLYRFGGEEFLVLMRCNSEEDAALALERFRSCTEQFEFPQVGRVTVSVGFTAVRPGDTPSCAFERADQAVYHAKQNGRNQVCSYTELVASGHLVEDTRIGDIELF